MDVLFMDDNEVNRDSIRISKLRKDHKITAPEFHGLDEGMEELKYNLGVAGFDVIILDLNWDNGQAKDGVAAAEWLRDAYAESGGDAPVIMLWSANTESLSPDELKLFDRVLRRKGFVDAIDEIAGALREVAEGALTPCRPNAALGAPQIAPSPVQG